MKRSLLSHNSLRNPTQFPRGRGGQWRLPAGPRKGGIAMLLFNVRRLTAAVALVLVLAGVPALAAPGPHSQAPQAPVAAHSLFDRFLDWLGFPPVASLPGVLSVF